MTIGIFQVKKETGGPTHRGRMCGPYPELGKGGGLSGLQVRTVIDGMGNPDQPGVAGVGDPTTRHCSRPVTCQAPRAAEDNC